MAQKVKASAYNLEDPGMIPGLGRSDSLEKGKATHFSTMA